MVKRDRLAESLAEARRYLEMTAQVLEVQTAAMKDLQRAARWLLEENRRLQEQGGDNGEDPGWIADILADLDDLPATDHPGKAEDGD